jgi:hypothetical protein
MAVEAPAFPVIAGGIMTGLTVVTGPWVNLRKVRECSFVAQWTNTPNGAFAFDVSNEPDTPTVATPLPLPAAFASGNPAGTATSYPFDFGPLPYAWIRMKYTNASSTGVLNAWFCGKG